MQLPENITLLQRSAWGLPWTELGQEWLQWILLESTQCHGTSWRTLWSSFSKVVRGALQVNGSLKVPILEFSFPTCVSNCSSRERLKMMSTYMPLALWIQRTTKGIRGDKLSREWADMAAATAPKTAGTRTHPFAGPSLIKSSTAFAALACQSRHLLHSLRIVVKIEVHLVYVTGDKTNHA